MRNSVLKSRCLQSAAILIATVSAASAQNVTAANVNVLNLLSPFLSLNASAIGRTTLTDNIETAIATNNAASLTLQELSYSDKIFWAPPPTPSPAFRASTASPPISRAACRTSRPPRAASRACSQSAASAQPSARSTATA